MTPPLIFTIVSVFIGFGFFTGSFVSFMYKKRPLVTWGLLVLAILCITVVPVTVATTWGTLSL